MRINSFWRFFKVFIFALFGSFMGLVVIMCGPAVNIIVVIVALIFGLGLSFAYFVGNKEHSTQHKVRVVKKSLYGQHCFVVEIDSILLPKLTWIPMMPDTTAKIRDIIPANRKLLIRVNLYLKDSLLQVRTIHCGLPPHVYEDEPQ